MLSICLEGGFSVGFGRSVKAADQGIVALDDRSPLVQ